MYAFFRVYAILLVWIPVNSDNKCLSWRPMYSMYRKEVFGYFNSFVGYLVISLFLVLSGLIHWVFPDLSIMDQGYASMHSFFALTPYLFFFLIPAITMRSVSGERIDGMLEWLKSKPVNNTQIILAKFLGGFTILCCTLLPTLVYVYTLHNLAVPVGNLDYGSIIGSYIGLLFLAAAFVAIGICVSVWSPNPVVSFLASVFMCFVMYYGFEASSTLVADGNWSEFINYLGMQYHYHALGRGVLDSRDVIYFLAVIFLFLYIAYLGLSLEIQKRKKGLLFKILTILLVLVAVNYAGKLWSVRYDFSDDKRFSLSEISKETLSELGSSLHISVLLDGDLPPGFVRLKNATSDLLSDLKSYAKEPLIIEFANPLDLDKQAREKWIDELVNRGVQPTQLNVRQGDGSLSQKLIFPVALVSDGQRELIVNLLQNNLGEYSEQTLNHSIENLEYNFISAIRKIGQENQVIIGFTEGHGELSDLELEDAMYSLLPHYQVGRIDLHQIDFEGLKQLDVLVVAKPTETFEESIKFKLDYFLMHGGNLIFSLDQLNGSLDSLRTSTNGLQTLMPRNLNLDDLLFTYGLRFNYDVLADMNCSQIPMNLGGAGGYNQLELVPWPLFPVFVPQTSHPLVYKLDGIQAEYAGTLDTIAVEGIKKEVVLHSSPFARTMVSPMEVSLSIVEQMPDPEEIRSIPKPVAAILEGRFSSAFYNRPLPSGIEEGVQVPSQGVPAKIFAVADGDFFKNQVNPADQSAYPLGWNRYTNQQFSNKVLLFNIMDYLLDDHSLIKLRSKEVKLRVLDRLKVERNKQYWQILNVLLPVIIVLAFGWIQQELRRRKYST